MAENFRDRGMEFAFPSLPTASPPSLLAALADAGGLGAVSLPTTVAELPFATMLTGACAISAAGLAMLMQPGRKGLRIAGTVVAIAGLAMLFVEALKATTGAGSAGAPPVFPVIFGFIALAGAVRMITHPRPVFAALYFILVVIATAGLFLLLRAEFMAFSLIIVYAGAILITYMFVLMLAQQSPAAGVAEAWYDRVPRESVSAVVVGFLMLATLGDAYFSPEARAERAAVAASAEARGVEDSWMRLDAMPKLLLENTRIAYAQEWKASRMGEDAGTAPVIESIVRDDSGRAITMSAGGASVAVRFADGSTGTVALPESMQPENSRQVGVDLVSKYPAGLEIAGVVLLMALFGAVILARKQIELGEDERRSLAGMRRVSVDGEPGGAR
ncbi:MAG: NADH-quinone oxidoreductase subunit J [Planctomycetota bacterium]